MVYIIYNFGGRDIEKKRFEDIYEQAKILERDVPTLVKQPLLKRTISLMREDEGDRTWEVKDKAINREENLQMYVFSEPRRFYERGDKNF